jgi:tetratricopeptide (TPR) repeat protein
MTLRAALRRALLFCAALLLGGCAVQTEALRRTLPPGLAPRVELATTPFFAQTDYHCGPAALATVLASAGRPVSPELLGEQIFLPARTGTLQLEMIAGARRQGVVATRLPGTLEALLRELQAGQPVVVLLNLGLSWYPQWHYAVAIGYDLPQGELLLRSGTTERAVLAMNTFEHTWVRAGSWAFVALPPDRWPATAEEPAVVEAAVGFERAAPPAQAVTAYRSALQRWSGSLSLQMGLGNVLYATGDKAGAAQAFEAAAARHPDSAPAWMNLASTRAELGQHDAALAAARQAASVADATWAAQARALLERLQRSFGASN